MAHFFVQRCIEGVMFGENSITAQQYLHVLHFEGPTPTVQASDVQAVTAMLNSWFNISYKALVPAEVSLRRSVAVGRDQLNGAYHERVSNVPGTRAGFTMPGSTTMAIKLAGTTRGRRRRGRVFTWPMVEADVNNDTFTTAYVDAAIAAFEALRAAANTAGYPLKVLSTVDEAMWAVTGFSVVDTRVDSQRRRLQTRGR